MPLVAMFAEILLLALPTTLTYSLIGVFNNQFAIVTVVWSVGISSWCLIAFWNHLRGLKARTGAFKSALPVVISLGFACMATLAIISQGLPAAFTAALVILTFSVLTLQYA